MIQNFGGGEILVIIILALVVLGPDRLPEMARSAGRMLHKVRTMTAGLQEQVKDVMDDPSMQPLRELGEIAARPRQKLSEYALEAEAEERARSEQASLDASEQAAEIIAAAQAAEAAELAATTPDPAAAMPEPSAAMPEPGVTPPADSGQTPAPPAAVEVPDVPAAPAATPAEDAPDDPVEPASHETA
jgi:sec-independent protein translocase protein TatB